MATVLPRTLTPTVLLYSFVVITQFAYGLYIEQHMEPPAGYELLHYYLVKSRGAKGVLIVLVFIGAYFGAAILGGVVSVAIAVFGQ